MNTIILKDKDISKLDKLNDRLQEFYESNIEKLDYSPAIELKNYQNEYYFEQVDCNENIREFNSIKVIIEFRYDYVKSSSLILFNKIRNEIKNDILEIVKSSYKNAFLEWQDDYYFEIVIFEGEYNE